MQSAGIKPDSWKLRDAKARFSELVRKARSGGPQTVTVHGRDTVVVSDAERFEVHPKSQRTRTMTDFLDASKKYRGVTEGIEFEHTFPMQIDTIRSSVGDD
jgi:prevent-host-death family protein